MSKQLKKALMDNLEEKLKDTSSVIITSFQGMNVNQLDDLRKQLRSNQSEYKIIKNRLTGKVIRNLKLEDFSKYFEGPTGLVIGKGDPVGPTKIVVKFSKDNENFKIKAGFLDGKIIDTKQITALSKVPGRNVLLTHLAGALSAPITNLAWVLQAKIQEFALILSALKEKKETENK